MALPLLMANIAGILLSARVYSLRRGQYRQLSEEKMLRSKLDLVASTDELTGIVNRRKFVEQAQNELGRCLRYKRPFTMLMLDLDHFKQVNDRYGHIAGDMVLQQFAEAVQLQIRGVDIFGRLGGEEFGIVLIETPLEQAREAADRIRQAFMNTQINIAHDIKIRATVSIGLSQSLTGNDALYMVVDKADKALYLAKQNGRNRVEVA
jgi:diguanylate cyclase (GGDEF)-like protein